ncbi:chemotaxis protein CheB [Sinorhizobium terangae]|uniref:Protein-glutamate methylesterase/protein-glutamine glutaminase n=1 Tax=Sinorhizobium terangae TaxID=110322 RepID=A0A6N7L8L6_SINTE|nr:chemotaxis protein CheB [Sinorhizobium terangae]MBB4184370.1 two-component system chemotaxis response regulator CheB [Sinorhizobium terangae]MQX14062.1 chemotaxis response regulator protein-glutamate methylesterase [Sinorhizobium terangae]WFU50344.1 chemotaxis protein CheB [Sinorhizobium terangae]
MTRILLATSTPGLEQLVNKAAGSDPAVELVGVARSGKDAVRITGKLLPDIVAVELRDNDTAETVREIMITAPTPVVMVSYQDGSQLGALSARALDAGALAVIPAPTASDASLEQAAIDKFLSTIKAMAQVKVVRQWRKKTSGDLPAEGAARPVASSPIGIVAIAASTGGPAAIRSILKDLPADFPAPILIVQHMSNGFIDGVAASLDSMVALKVKVGANGERLRPGTVYLAPDGHQLGVSGKSRLRVVDEAPIQGFKPSGSYLFGSIARSFRAESLAVILTGMGDDGTEGLRALHVAGGKVIAQDEKSSIVFGMPKSAISAGLVDFVLPVEEIARKITALAS